MTRATLIFYPDTADGRMLHLDQIDGTPVKAGLGVRMGGTPERPWLNLYDTAHGRHIRHRAREANIQWFRNCVPALAAAGFYERTRYKELWLGRTIFDAALHRMEAVVHQLMLIEALRTHHGITSFATWRADELPRDRQDAIAAYSAARGIPFTPLDAPPVDAFSGPSTSLVGHYEYYGTFGREIASIRPGHQTGFPGLTTQWGYVDFNRAKLPIDIALAPDATDAAVVLRVLYIHCEKGHPTITLATARHEAIVTIEADGVFDRTLEPRVRLAPATGPMELPFTAWIAAGEGWFGLLGDTCHPLRLRPRSVAHPGVTIDCPESQWPTVRFGEVTVLTDLDSATCARRRTGLAACIGEPSRSQAALRSISSVAPVVATFIPAQSHMVASWPHLGRRVAPIHFEGFAPALSRQGFIVTSFLPAPPWLIDGTPTLAAPGTVALDSVVRPDADIAATKAAAADIVQTLPDVVGITDLPMPPECATGLDDIEFRPLLRRSLIEGAQWAGYYCEQYEKSRIALSTHDVSVVISPRLELRLLDGKRCRPIARHQVGFARNFFPTLRAPAPASSGWHSRSDGCIVLLGNRGDQALRGRRTGRTKRTLRRAACPRLLYRARNTAR